MMMSIALRFIPTLIEETDKIMNAQKARGAMLDTGKLTERVKALVPVLIPLFISAFRRADELAHGHGVPLLPRGRGPHPPQGAALLRAGLHRPCLLHRVLWGDPGLAAGVPQLLKRRLDCQPC